MLKIEDQKKIADILNSKMPAMKCPMCQHTKFMLADGYFSNTVQAGVDAMGIGGPFIPTVPIICSHCGFISQHALGVLGMLPVEKIKPESK